MISMILPMGQAAQSAAGSDARAAKDRETEKVGNGV